jgi:uncharacterized protein (TIGR02599 family)
MTILSVLMVVVVNVIGIVQQQWTRANSKVTAFREARMAFDVITRNLSQATLNTYWTTIDNPLPNDAANQKRFQASKYVRKSELQFVSGRTTGILTAASGSPDVYPGHAVFFQAPLGVTRLVGGGVAINTENMTNLLSARGYFVSWGDDQGFRPAFLNGAGTVGLRYRYRLMEYSPTAESNRIYYDPANSVDLADRLEITAPTRTRTWFQDAINSSRSEVKSSETADTHAFTRPVADNIIALVISPQYEKSASVTAPESIAPFYEYDSVYGPYPAQGPSVPARNANPGAPPPNSANPQGTQHLLPPLIKITMISLDSAAGEKLAENGNEEQQKRLASTLAPLFTSAASYNSPTSSYHKDLNAVETFLINEHLNYRIFTTTVIMKQSRWSH